MAVAAARCGLTVPHGEVVNEGLRANKFFGLSGKLLHDHNAGVREEIRVCHECVTHRAAVPCPCSSHRL
eukprot:1948019-Prymnesium_polylepis.1